MKTIKSEFIGTDATGKDFFRVIIVSESAPDSFPTSGADVDGVPDTAGIAAGSVLLTPDGNSVLYADGWSEGSGDPTVTINNITGDPVEIYVAESIEALVGGTSETVLIADGESTQTFTAGSVFAFAPDSPLEVSINSGDISLKDYMGVPYWEVGGNGSIVISSTI